MFKCCGAGQRIFPSEPAAPSMAPAPAPMTTSDSIPADLGYSISRPAVLRQVRLSVSSAIHHGSRRWIGPEVLPVLEIPVGEFNLLHRTGVGGSSPPPNPKTAPGTS